MKDKKFFFKGLNELRALAACFVIFHHIELFKFREGISSIYNLNYFTYFIDHLGKNGVYLFFVLSGFLITFLLLQEKSKYDTILLKKFFFRRMFRIWPLYYLIIFVSFVIIPLITKEFNIFENTQSYYLKITNPYNYSFSSVIYYVLFLPNIALYYFKIYLVGASQSWSVGVEEQFYVIWPFILLLFSSKKSIYVFISIAFLFITTTYLHIPYISLITKLIPFEYMAIGGIGGYLYYYYSEKIKFYTQSKYFYLLNLLLIFLFLFFKLFPGYLQNIGLSILFLTLILITINDTNKLVFRNDYFSFLGKISYGIYMYHPFIMFLVFPVLIEYIDPNKSIIWFNILIYIFIFGLSFGISHISYNYFESFFIKFKNKKFGTL
ncbi:acyltransferase family protein [Leeuwenhoekiella sp. LLG6367-2.1]|uniref:acyltransferase family protein n=1 Tax=Leeuwenhoekiella sp. LLG6367-2.1 TaxID=3160833 RepID=UPI00386E4356